MRVLCLYCALFLAVVVAACGGDEPVSVSEPQTQTQRASEPVAQQEAPGQSAAQASRRPGDVDRAAESEAEPAAADEPEEAPPAEASSAEETAQVSEQPSPEAAPARTDDQAEEARPEPRQHPLDRTDVPAAVVQDADVRMRPGLAWPVMDRLESGASVAVLQHADGWYRIRFGGDLEGWIRTTMLDLGRVGQRQVLEKPAPPLIAEWRGEEHGVMGLSADGAEVRLLKIEDETSIIIGAPIDEVNLPAGDVTLQDLPILIGDETVIFPGDDFRVGQGKILPRANEWMWLPWGWLLAHNDTHIWQWRPETDELEFIARPPGIAWLSPDGERLGIIRCPPEPDTCDGIDDVYFVHLNGSAPTSLRALLSDATVAERATWLSHYSANHLTWLGDGHIALLSLVTRTDALGLTAILFDDAGGARLIPFGGQGAVDGRSCRVYPPDIGGWSTPLLAADHVLVGWGTCWSDDQTVVQGHLLFDLNRDAFRLEEAAYRVEAETSYEFLSTALGGDKLGPDLETHWSATRSRALIFDFDSEAMWIYDEEIDGLIPVQDHTGAMADALSQGNVFTRDVFWHEDEAVAVLARWDFTRTVGAILVDANAAVGRPMRYDQINQWACFPAGVWSPNGRLFQTTFSRSSFDGVGQSNRGHWYWIDGAAGMFNTVWQHVISYSDGSLAGVQRAIGPISQFPSQHVGGWSRDGRWFAMGGHQHRNGCIRGE